MTRFNIATCRHCGAEYQPPMLGETSDLCPDCRQAADPAAAPTAPRKVSTSELIRLFPVTAALIALNLLMFVVMVAKGVSPAQPSTTELLRWGADFGPRTFGGQPWRVLVSCFIHAGFLHLLFNMWCLWSLGMFVERFLGRGTYLLAYLLAGVAGAVASVWWHPLSVGVGASGAIFGLAGLMVTLLRSGQLSLPAAYLKQHSKSILAFIGYNLFFGFISPHIDNAAHLGGLGAGLLMGALLPVMDSEEGHGRRVLAFGLLVVVLFVGFTYARSANAGPLALAAGEEALQAKQWDKAASLFQAAIRSNPNQPDAYLGLGYVYLMQEKYAEAVPVLQKATQLAPHAAGGFTNLGYALVKSDRPKEAEAPLLRALQIDPKDADAWENLAMAYALEGKDRAARNAAQNALRFNPKMKEAQKILETLEAGQEPSQETTAPRKTGK